MTSGAGLSPHGKSFNMLAIIESWEEEGSYYEDSTGQFLFILLLKVGLDCLVLSMCLRWLHTSFMGVCGLSVFLVDVVLLCAVAAVWFLGPARSPVSICFLLAHASAVFNALPLPMLSLGLLDYASEPRYTTCHDAPCRDLWNYSLTLLVWVLAGVHSCCSAVTNLLEVEYEGGRNALGCTVQESVFVVHFSVGISVAICCVMLLHYKQMPLWLKEANRPPLYLSLTLDFGTTWASYLVMCIACELLSLAVPAYISINLLWLECANSVLVGLVFCGVCAPIWGGIFSFSSNTKSLWLGRK
uniref:Uncharacterized protein n=1 Tax=Oncorhynchus mykiss TaxID=8022 RepID=A0A8C7QM02_ONCMY